MSIVSFAFFIFIAFVYAAYWLCAPGIRWVPLLLASVFFMLCGTQFRAELCCIFAAETLLTWLTALGLKRIRQERVKTWLTGAVIAILTVVLILYKDIAFFVNNINLLRGGRNVPESAAMGSTVWDQLLYADTDRVFAGCALGNSGTSAEKSI